MNASTVSTTSNILVNHSVIRRPANSFFLSIESRLQSFCEIGRRSDTPVMQKDNPGRFRLYVVVDRNDIDTGAAQCFQHRLKLLLQHYKIAINNCLLVASDKCCPGVDAHGIPDLMSAHLRRTADSDFVNTAR